MKRNFLSALLFLTFVTPVFGADQSDSNVSQVKGQIVPDGDRHQYYLDYKQWNISTNPLGLISGSYSVTGSYAFHKNFALKADANYSNPVYGSETGQEFAVSVPIYFRKAYEGFSLEPGIMYRAKHYGDGKTSTQVGPQVILAYSWMWDSGLNIAVGAGAGRNWLAKKDDADKIFGNAFLRFGYAF